MINRYERSRREQTIENVLLLVHSLPEGKLHLHNSRCADRELMALADVVFMFVLCNRGKHGVATPLIVRDGDHVVAHRVIGPDDFRTGLCAIGESSPGIAMCMQVRSLPPSM